MISNAPGSVVDVSHPDYLARTMSLFAVAPFNGPVTGPIIGGFVFQYMGWRWATWIVLVLAGTCVALMLTVKETYAPTILRRKAARLRRQTGDPRWWCQYDQQRLSSLQLLRVNLSRPLILFATEPILWFMNLWSVSLPVVMRGPCAGRAPVRCAGPMRRSVRGSFPRPGRRRT